jgi:hypothetical protein
VNSRGAASASVVLAIVGFCLFACVACGTHTRVVLASSCTRARKYIGRVVPLPHPAPFHATPRHSSPLLAIPHASRERYRQVAPTTSLVSSAPVRFFLHMHTRVCAVRAILSTAFTSSSPLFTLPAPSLSLYFGAGRRARDFSRVYGKAPGPGAADLVPTSGSREPRNWQATATATSTLTATATQRQQHSDSNTATATAAATLAFVEEKVFFSSSAVLFLQRGTLSTRRLPNFCARSFRRTLSRFSPDSRKSFDFG